MWVSYLRYLVTQAHLQYNSQQRDKGWFDNNKNPINPLTAQEWQNPKASSSISAESQVSVSDAYTAMEYYLFADSPDAFYKLSSESLAHLYFLKIKGKPLKGIWRLAKKKLIEALMKAVCKLPVFWS